LDNLIWLYFPLDRKVEQTDSLSRGTVIHEI